MQRCQMAAAAAAAAAAEQLPRAAAPVLRCGTHNICGLTTEAAAGLAAASWQGAGYHVVFLQEHHLTLFTGTRVARRLHQCGWKAFFAFSPPGPGGHARAGTGIIIRSDLLASGDLSIEGGEPAVRRAADGRYTAMPVRWSGHHLYLCSIYMPNNSTAQRQFIADALVPLAADAAGRQVLWGGDFNFVPSPHLDRLGHAAGAVHPDVGTQQRWQEALPGLLDAYRERHPGRRAYTYVHSQAASRLDRFYVSPALMPYVATCTVRGRTTSDHRPVSLALVGMQPASVGPGLRRARLGFFSSPSLLQQMQDWLEHQLEGAPEDPYALLIWWPQFKRRWAAECGELHRASRRMAQEAEAAGDELAALHAQLDAGQEDVLPAIIAARQRFTEAWQADMAESALRRRQRWLHCGERPCRALTRRLRQRQQDRVVAALRDATGQLRHSGSALAQCVVRHWAGVMRQPVVDAAAQQEVLHALSGGRQLTAEQAAGLGGAEVLPAEVLRALRTAPSGKSPGHDGIPVELYRKFKDHMAPLLARLFTAIATLRALPARFHAGLITIIFKAGERSDPANYRPITLLCTDYRLFAKVLALRLNPCLDSIIDREQTAFVPGRLIGENIMTLQCLPHLLRRRGSSAVVAFCDFRKAYDTLDRGFLFRAMHALGLGEGFLALTRLLLTDTMARAMVNAHISTPAAFAAGVRQGCPLAPLLYLFIAQALLRLLKARGIGIDVAGRRLTALQYADDAEALLPSLASIPAFLDTMNTFGDATGQRLNPSKTQLLPIGAVPAGLPATAHGLTVVGTATALGVTVDSAGQPAAGWPKLLEGVRQCYAKLATLPRMSVFGRGFASAGYGVSKVLYHAEFAGHPPDPHLAELARITAKVVDRGQAPNDNSRRFAGLAGWLLPGRPAEGGFGALPWREHITARHAWWGVQLIVGSEQVPWIAVARALLRSCAEMPAHPLGLLLWPAAQPLPGSVALLPEPLRRLLAGLASLPRVEEVSEQPLQLGLWCWAAPLWGNPYFASPAFPGGPDFDFFDFAAAGISSLGQLLHLQQALGVVAGPAAYSLIWTTMLQRYPAFASRHHTAERVQQLLEALPASWVQAARTAASAMAAGQLQQPQPGDAAAAMLQPLGWRQPGGRQPVQLAAFTVKAGTALLTAPAEQCRAEQRLEPYAAQFGGSASGLRQLLKRLWRLQWENSRKEPFWRLVYDAFPTAARLHLDQPCLCGGQPADRDHHFWACPVACAVTSSINQAVQDWQPAAGPLGRESVWLCRPPAGVHPGVWDVVCLAAVEAMDHGRRRMHAMRMGPAAPPQPADIVASSARSARARFWCLLADFVALRCAPASWQEQLPPAHPFISFHVPTAAFRVSRPAEVPPMPTQ